MHISATLEFSNRLPAKMGDYRRRMAQLQKKYCRSSRTGRTNRVIRTPPVGNTYGSQITLEQTGKLISTGADKRLAQAPRGGILSASRVEKAQWL